MADIKVVKDQIWYIKRDIQNEEKKRDEWATTVRYQFREQLRFANMLTDLRN